MMYPRIFFARQLLRDDGVILVSCNDIEQAHLKLLLNEVFGEENFVVTLIWNNEGNIDNQSKVKTNHEYIHMFARTLNRFERPSVIDPNVEETSKLYRDEIENSITKNGPANPPSKVFLPVGFPTTFGAGIIEARTDVYPYIYNRVEVKDFATVDPVTVESGWSSKNLLRLFISNGFQPIMDAEGKETRFALTEAGAIYGYKKRLAEQGHVLTVIRNVGTTKQNSAMLARWGLDFDWPKPVLLIRYLCQIATKGEDLILDFFAGSSTTAQAVLELNREDGGNRRYIMVQLPEPTPEKSKARKAGYNTIAEIGKERIKCVIKNLRDEKAGRLDLKNRETPEDLGFRVFKLAESNYKPWTVVEEADPEAYAQHLALYEDQLRPEWRERPKNLIWEVALREGYVLTSRIERLKDTNYDKVYRVTDPDKGQSFVICLDDQVGTNAVHALGLGKDDLFICRDAALTDSYQMRMYNTALW